MFAPAFGAAISGGYGFGQVGGNGGHADFKHKFRRFAGAYPPNIWSRGGISKTPRARQSR